MIFEPSNVVSFLGSGCNTENPLSYRSPLVPTLKMLRFLGLFGGYKKVPTKSGPLTQDFVFCPSNVKDRKDFYH